MKRLLMVLGICWAASGAVRASDDWQFWQEGVVQAYKKGIYQSSVLGHARFDRDMSHLYFFFVKERNLFRLHRYASAAFSYSYLKNLNSKNVWKEEHRPDVEFIPAYAWGPLSFENRARMEARLIEDDGRDVVWRYRNRFQVSYAPSSWGKKASLFANEEIFYDFTAETRNQNRVFAGVKASPAAWLSASLSWGVQSLLQGASWESRQLVFLSFEFKR